jgi:hypothetical protein
MEPKVYVLILNWNGWKDTIECLESVFRLNYSNYQVIVCDNMSQDSSMEHIIEWAEGIENISVEIDHPLAFLSTPPIQKPLPFIELNQKEEEKIQTEKISNIPLILIQTGANLGFAGGNNVGLRYALKRDDFEFVWLLNNDTVVDPDCLRRMVNYSLSRKRPNTCGSRILFYDDPKVIQALGGAHYYKWRGIASTTLGRYKSANDYIDPAIYERRLSYITGASWLIPKKFLKEVGLMEEGYFLYFEEIDWCIRGHDKFELCYADDAFVYHKEGQSIGSPSGDKTSSMLSDFYIFRNKLIFTRKYFPKALLTAYITTFLQALNRARRGQWKKATLILKILFGKKNFEK